MAWSDAVPNLLIGLREGLEAGLVVSILLAAVHRTGDGERRISTTPIWLGVLGAVMVAGSFAAVLTYSTDVLSSRAQEAVGGILSVLAVGLVTGMVFWMRRTAATLSAHLKGEVARAAAIGAGALALTAFLAVGREGLETTLFIWTAVKASGQTVAPLFGAGLGLAIAVVACALLYRRAIRINLGVFFSRTALALIVIAAGVLAYGLGDLQDASLLPGTKWVMFDLTAHIDPNAWWVTIITGVTELAPKMSVLQVVAYLAYLVAVVPAFVIAGRRQPAPAPAAATEPAAPAGPSRWERLVGARLWTTAGVLVAAPALAAGITIAAIPSASAATTTDVTITRTGCAKDWSNPHTGNQTFNVDNKSGKAGEINLDDSGGRIVAEIETIGPATTASMTGSLSPGTYTMKCLMSGGRTTTSAPVQVAGRVTAKGIGPAAVAPITVQALAGPNTRYEDYAAGVLATLATDVGRINADLAAGNLAQARSDWLPAQLDWERVGASYDSFGDDGTAVDGLPDGLPKGVADPGFTGLHRLEYGLWHGQSAAELVPVGTQLTADVAKAQKDLRTDDEAGDPTNLPIRAHEILEDALRDHLSGIDDEGAGAAYPETTADVAVTRTVLSELAPLITARSPGLMATADRQLDALSASLTAAQPGGTFQAPQATPGAARENVNAAIGNLLQTLDSVPNLLEVPPSH